MDTIFNILEAHWLLLARTIILDGCIFKGIDLWKGQSAIIATAFFTTKDRRSLPIELIAAFTLGHESVSVTFGYMNDGFEFDIPSTFEINPKNITETTLIDLLNKWTPEFDLEDHYCTIHQMPKHDGCCNACERSPFLAAEFRFENSWS